MLRIRRSEVSSAWRPAVAASLLWGLAAASAVLWWLHWPRGQALTVPLAVQAAAGGPAQPQSSVERALGHARPVAATPDAQKRFTLLGVISADSGRGSALLSVDGQAPQAYLQGQWVVDGWRVHQLGPQQVQLSSSAGWLTLPMPQGR